MKVIDISVPLSAATPIWPGDPSFLVAEQRLGPVTVSRLEMGLHTGTHIDVPYHFLPGGKRLDAYAPDSFIGAVRVCAIHDGSHVTVDELKTKDLTGVEKVIFKTSNSNLWQETKFCPGFVSLEPDAAHYLVDCGINLVGIDYLSIQGFANPDNGVHTILLSHDVLILEGLNLTGVEEGDYLLVCCPLRILDAEASPVRALLLSQFDVKGNAP